jgi:hypothetical protein
MEDKEDNVVNNNQSEVMLKSGTIPEDCQNYGAFNSIHGIYYILHDIPAVLFPL